jgi:hypothetical protein
MPNEIKFDSENLADGEELGKDDLLADLIDQEIEAQGPKQTPSVNEDEYNALKAKVEELEGANAGLLKAKQSEVSKRQASNDRLNQMEGAINAILSQRQQRGMESVTEAEAAGARAQGIPVTYDDDGNGWIDPNYIAQLTTPYEQRIMELEQKLNQTDAASSASAQAQRIMDGIIGEDERFVPASNRYKAARKWVEDQVLEWTNANGVGRNLTSGEALDHVFSDAYTQQQFGKMFDGVDLVDVVTAEDSQQHFRRALSNIADAMTPAQDLANAGEKMDSRFQKVLNKPSTLGNNANAKAGQLSIMEKVGNFSTQDIMDLSDEQINALMSAVSKE